MLLECSGVPLPLDICPPHPGSPLSFPFLHTRTMQNSHGDVLLKTGSCSHPSANSTSPPNTRLKEDDEDEQLTENKRGGGGTKPAVEPPALSSEWNNICVTQLSLLIDCEECRGRRGGALWLAAEERQRCLNWMKFKLLSNLISQWLTGFFPFSMMWRKIEEFTGTQRGLSLWIFYSFITSGKNKQINKYSI